MAGLKGKILSEDSKEFNLLSLWLFGITGLKASESGLITGRSPEKHGFAHGISKRYLLALLAPFGIPLGAPCTVFHILYRGFWAPGIPSRGCTKVI